jgi:ABC-type multidrug transport system ATPase subunit
MALIGDPKLLILDEPSANLDLKAREKILDIIRSLVLREDSKMSVLIST